MTHFCKIPCFFLKGSSCFHILWMVQGFFPEAESQQSRECCQAWPYLPRSPVEDGHRGGRPWRPRLSDAVAVIPKNDWFHGSGQCSPTAQGETLPHLGEEALAGREMLLNKVVPGVMVRPVTPTQTHTHSTVKECTARPRDTYGEYWVWIYPLFEVGVWLGLCLPLCEVLVNLQTTMSWFERENIQAEISRDNPSVNGCSCSKAVFFIPKKI